MLVLPREAPNKHLEVLGTLTHSLYYMQNFCLKSSNFYITSLISCSIHFYAFIICQVHRIVCVKIKLSGSVLSLSFATLAGYGKIALSIVHANKAQYFYYLVLHFAEILTAEIIICCQNIPKSTR